MTTQTDAQPWQEMLSTEQRKFLNADEARGLLDYDRDSGDLRWKQHMTPRARAGTVAGVIQEGKYRRVGIYGRYYLAHRLAWLIATGEWPPHEIDHINGIKSDNRLCNLRLATSAQNNRNTIHHNRAGLVGASYSSTKGMYRAQIRVGGKRKFLGWFTTADEASAVYTAAARKYHREFAGC